MPGYVLAGARSLAPMNPILSPDWLRYIMISSANQSVQPVIRTASERVSFRLSPRSEGLAMQTKSKKIAYYQLGRHRVPDYLPGILAAITLLFGFPFLVQSQQSVEIRAEEVADGRYVLFGRGGNILASLEVKA